MYMASFNVVNWSANQRKRCHDMDNIVDSDKKLFLSHFIRIYPVYNGINFCIGLKGLWKT